MDQLNDTFSYKELENALKNSLPAIGSTVEEMKLKHEILSAVNTNYEIQFPADSLLSERMIFPVTRAEKNGMEDARFVKFTEDDGSCCYIATYTAYDGAVILPQLIITKDFCRFKIAPLHGQAAVNKNLALFPRKSMVVMLCYPGLTGSIIISCFLMTSICGRKLHCCSDQNITGNLYR